jgi:hypothetical protein
MEGLDYLINQNYVKSFNFDDFNDFQAWARPSKCLLKPKKMFKFTIKGENICSGQSSVH